MDNTVDIRMRLKDLVQCGLVGDVQLVEFGLLAADQFHAAQGLLVRVAEAVDHNNLVVRLEKGEDGVGTNVTGSSERGC